MALPSVTLGKERSANCTSATVSLPSTFCRALDKEFAECHLTLDKEFVECHLTLGKEKSPSRRQVTVTDPLPSVFYHGPRQRVLQWAPLPVPLLSALATALDKDGFAGSQVSFFGECHGQHSAKMALPIPRFPSLPSVTLGKVTRMSLFYLFLLFYPNKQKIYIIHITLYINHITE
jgi:hypothetical protein